MEENNQNNEETKYELPFFELEYVGSLSTKKQFELALNSNLNQFPLFIPPNLIRSVFSK
jgi:hypothetical protein